MKREGALYWLTYRRAGKMIGVVIIDSTSLKHARNRVTLDGLDGLDGDAEFGEGRWLDAKRAGLVPAEAIGRMLSIAKAVQLLRRFDGRRHYYEASATMRRDTASK